jgi:alpha-L-fucosidase
VFRLDGLSKINCIALEEAIQFGQKVAAFKVLFYNNEKTVGEIAATTIGRKRILSFPAKNITSFEVVITKAKATPMITEVAAYLIDENLIEQ